MLFEIHIGKPRVLRCVLRLTGVIGLNYCPPLEMEVAQADDTLTYWTAFAIPVVLIAVTAFGQKLIEKVPFRWRHFYLGLDLCVAAMAASLVNILDLLKRQPPEQHKIDFTVLFVVLCILLFVVLLAIHQEWEDEKKFCKQQIFWLFGASNLIGLALIGGFIRLKVRGAL